MRKITIICDRCGKQIDKEAYRLLNCVIDMTTGDNSNDIRGFNLGAGTLDFCTECIAEVDKEIYMTYSRVKPIKKLVEEKKAEVTQSSGNSVGRKFKPLDDGKIKALREAGWSYDKIAEEMGCSPQTISNRLRALEVIKKHEEDAKKFKEYRGGIV